MKKLLIGLLLVIGTIAALATGILRSSLPELDGTITLKGLSADVTITRDAYGVPHIVAETRHDLYFASGFVHAQDRLWQMEMNRRIGRGRVAEILGESALQIDRMVRTFGFPRKAEKALATITAEGRAALDAYAAGVNAFLEYRRGALPPEFLLVGIEPEPWKPIDTLVWSKMMWFDLSKNMSEEISRALLLTKLTPDQVQAIFPTYPGEKAEAPLPNLSDIYASLPLDDMLAVYGEPKEAAHGSNNWVVSGAHTETGSPMLANDPHLGLTTPSIWYLMHLHDKETGRHAVGVSFPGSPGLVLGRNDKMAWGFTNTASDVQDLFIEKLLDDDQYLTPDGPADLILFEEVIKIKGEDPEILTVRETRHGPIVSDLLPIGEDVVADGYGVALQWTALMDTDPSVDVLLNTLDAETFDEFRSATRSYAGPEQNMVFADVSGAIGYTAPARVPVRKPDNMIKGRLPSPGWDSRYDWDGYLPYEAMPLQDNPASGVVATANERIVPFDYPHYLTRDWTLPYRGNRIRHRLEADAPLSMADMNDIQNDQISDFARALLPSLMILLPKDSPARPVFEGWDGAMTRDSAAAALFQHWHRRYWEALISDELGPKLFERVRGPRGQLLASSIIHTAGADVVKYGSAYYEFALMDPSVALSWCDDTSTKDAIETCKDLALSVMDQSFRELSDQLGSDTASWRWGTLHQLTQTHRPFTNVPALGKYFHLSGEQGGSPYTVNVAGVSNTPDTFLTSSMGPSYRGIFDLADLDQSLYALPTGQSGHPLSKHHGDLYKLWDRGELFKIPTDPAKIEAVHSLTLTPKR